MLVFTNFHRDQQSLPLRNSFAFDCGFDTLNKAFVVWQDSTWSFQNFDFVVNSQIRNSNPHWRVDIIISSWRTIGFAVERWTFDTTFQRNFRRYAKKIKGWKFDSSGVRDRESGRWVDLKKWSNLATRCTDWRVAEKRVFKGLVWFIASHGRVVRGRLARGEGDKSQFELKLNHILRISIRPVKLWPLKPHLPLYI